MLILTDAASRPELFFWNGKIERAHLDSLLSEAGFSMPDDLAELLAVTGGGDFFESETLLGPFSEQDVENLFWLNRWRWANGLNKNLLLFHEGVIPTAVDQATGEYLSIVGDAEKVVKRFPRFDDWYRDYRRDFAESYGGLVLDP